MPHRNLPSRIPAIMYHSVGRRDPAWGWSELTTDVDFFGQQMARLVAAGYRSVSLDEFHERRRHRPEARDKIVALTFDDGYLDNWLYVAPILREHGLTGTVYVNCDFIDPSGAPRGEAAAPGFLNWPELRALESDGVLHVANHSRTHTWYPTGPDIVDFHRPGTFHPWLSWNARPERKTFYLAEDQAEFVPWGTPVHRSGRSLGIRRFLPDPRVADACHRHVGRAGGAAFFSRPDWRKELQRVAMEADPGGGRYETDAEQDERFRDEIFGSRETLEAGLGRPVRHFCWPGGAYCDTSFALAEASDLLTVTVTARDERRRHSSDPRFLRRLGCHDTVTVFGRRYPTRDPQALLWACETVRGRWDARLWRTANKLGVALHHLVQR